MLIPIDKVEPTGLDVLIREHVLDEPRTRMFKQDRRVDGSVFYYLTTAMNLGAPSGAFSTNADAALWALERFVKKTGVRPELRYLIPTDKRILPFWEARILCRFDNAHPSVAKHELPARAVVYAILDMLQIHEVDPWWRQFTGDDS